MCDSCHFSFVSFLPVPFVHVCFYRATFPFGIFVYIENMTINEYHNQSGNSEPSRTMLPNFIGLITNGRAKWKSENKKFLNSTTKNVYYHDFKEYYILAL